MAPAVAPAPSKPAVDPMERINKYISDNQGCTITTWKGGGHLRRRQRGKTFLVHSNATKTTLHEKMIRAVCGGNRDSAIFVVVSVRTNKRHHHHRTRKFP
jgi:hypothetical protein